MMHPCNNSSSNFLVSSVFGAASSLSTAAYSIAANTCDRSYNKTAFKFATSNRQYVATGAQWVEN